MTDETKENESENGQADQASDTAPRESSPAQERNTDLVIDDHDDIEPEDSEALDAAEEAAAEMSEEERIERVAALKPIVEGAVMASSEALKLSRIQSLFEEHEVPSKGLLIEILEQIQKDCEGRGFQLIEVASGWRFQVREDYAAWVNRLWDEKPQKYSRALLETLALIAYRQPLTRGDIEEVRGVAVSSHIIKTLAERDWVKVVGHRDVPGRPSLYATTKTFLDYFNLKSLDELPTLGELKDIESLNASLELESQLPPEMIAEMKAEDAAANDISKGNETHEHNESLDGQQGDVADGVEGADRAVGSEQALSEPDLTQIDHECVTEPDKENEADQSPVEASTEGAASSLFGGDTLDLSENVGEISSAEGEAIDTGSEEEKHMEENYSTENHTTENLSAEDSSKENRLEKN